MPVPRANPTHTISVSLLLVIVLGALAATAEEDGTEHQRITHWETVGKLADALESFARVGIGTCEARAATYHAGDVFRDRRRSGGEGPEMVVIPAGRFRMGCVSGLECFDREKPVHEVSIPHPFALSVYEVTFAQWDACAGAGVCDAYRPHDWGWSRRDRPVDTVSWKDAKSYVSWLSQETGESYRLPSEAEWEYAARAGSETKYSWGNEIGLNRANCSDCGSQWAASARRHSNSGRRAPVGSFAPNAFGLYDMHGNVWEWVEDCWNRGYSGAPSNGSAWLNGDCAVRIMRGGSWRWPSRIVRAANRSGGSADLRYSQVGFRVARTLTP